MLVEYKGEGEDEEEKIICKVISNAKGRVRRKGRRVHIHVTHIIRNHHCHYHSSLSIQHSVPLNTYHCHHLPSSHSPLSSLLSSLSFRHHVAFSVIHTGERRRVQQEKEEEYLSLSNPHVWNNASGPVFHLFSSSSFFLFFSSLLFFLFFLLLLSSSSSFSSSLYLAM